MADPNKPVERVFIANFYQSVNEANKIGVSLPVDTIGMNFKIDTLSFDKSVLYARHDAMLQDPEYQKWQEQKLEREQWEVNKQQATDTDFEEVPPVAEGTSIWIASANVDWLKNFNKDRIKERVNDRKTRLFQLLSKIEY